MKKQTLKAALLMLLTLIAIMLFFAVSCSAQDKTKWIIYFEKGVQVAPLQDTTDVRWADPSTVFKVWEHESGCNDYFYIAATPSRRDTFMVSFVPNRKEILAFFQDGELVVFEPKNKK